MITLIGIHISFPPLSISTDIPHIKIMRANNFVLFIQQVQITIFIQLKQGFFLSKESIK